MVIPVHANNANAVKTTENPAILRSMFKPV